MIEYKKVRIMARQIISNEMLLPVSEKPFVWRGQLLKWMKEEAAKVPDCATAIRQLKEKYFGKDFNTAHEMWSFICSEYREKTFENMDKALEGLRNQVEVLKPEEIEAVDIVEKRFDRYLMKHNFKLTVIKVKEILLYPLLDLFVKFPVSAVKTAIDLAKVLVDHFRRRDKTRTSLSKINIVKKVVKEAKWVAVAERLAY